MPEKTPFELVTEQINALNARISAVATSLEDNSGPVEESKALIADLRTELQPLISQQQEALRDEEMKALRGEVKDLSSVIADLRKPAGAFVLPTDDSGQHDDDPYQYEEGKGLADEPIFVAKKKGRSFFADIRRANKGHADAKERLIHGFDEEYQRDRKLEIDEDGKALSGISEGVTGAPAPGFTGGSVSNTGGFLVRPQIERQIVLARESDNVLRGLCSKLNVTSNAIQLDQLGLTTTAGWVAELAEKPSATTLSTASVTANIFTAAGLAVVSNQLLADSNPGIDQLAIQDIAKRLVALEEIAFIDGSGTGQPFGILNTAGISITNPAAATYVAIVDAVLDAIAAVEGNHGSPTGILMHPRTWTGILKAKTGAGGYFFGDPNVNNPDVRSNRTVYQGPQKQLWGYPVYTTNRMPITKGGGTESRIIVGDFREALILDRQGITVDESAHFLFTQNATIFRAEERVGFTAARTTAAFQVLGGANMAGL
jgi:HK97 family phage major capsid protein